MLVLAKICEALLPIAYSATVAFYALSFYRREDLFQRWTRPLLLTSVAVHSLLIYARTMLHGHCLVYTPFELMTLLSFMVSLTYLVVESTSGERSTGLFFTGLALVFQTLSAMFAPGLGASPPPEQLMSNAVGLHVSAALFGYTAFTISAVYGALYLMLYHQIRSNHFGTFYNRLPSLQLLERLSEKGALVGVIFLTIAIIIALVWLPDVVPGFSYSDPKLIVEGLVWGVYVAALVAKYTARLEGRKVMIMSLVGFAGSVLSLTVINALLTGFHRFG